MHALRLFLFVTCLATSASAAERLVVGTKVAPPFSMKDGEGDWRGLSIELWERVALDLDLEFDYVERDLDDLLEECSEGKLDLAVAAISMTAEREDVLDFSHPTMASGLAIAVKPEGGAALAAVLEGIFSVQMLKAVGGLLALLFAVGLVLWVFERRRNDEQFGGTVAEGIGSGFWWSAVTMTTVGYGDKAPVTVGGRVIGFLWMFASIILISAFTAAIASSLTIDSMQGRIQGPDDLAGVRTGCLEGSTSQAYLTRRGFAHSGFAHLEDALRALEAGEVSAVVHDEPILRYTVKELEGDSLRVLPQIFERQPYGFALPPDSPLRERLNRQLLETLPSSWWHETVERTLGK